MEIRQTRGWAKYMRSINWQVEKIGKTQIFIRKFPLLPLSFIKIQHPENPLPFSEINKIAKKNNAIMVVIEPSLKKYDDKGFIKYGYIPSNQPMVHASTIQIDLTPSLPKIFKSFSENARRNIKKAIANNIEIKKIPIYQDKDLKNFENFLALLKTLTTNKKFWVPDDKEMKQKVTSLKDSILLFAFEQHTNTPIASVWLGITKDSSHYIQTGNTNRGYELLANYLLVWEIVKTSKKMGLKYFDFEGIFDPRFPTSNPRWKNFSDFKKRFHGNLIQYPHPWIKFSNVFFKWFYKLGQILP